MRIALKVNKFIITGLVILVIGITVFIDQPTVQVHEEARFPYSVSEDREKIIDRSENFSVVWYTFMSYELDGDTTLIITWNADKNVTIILSTTRSTINPNLAEQSGMSASLSYNLSYGGLYLVFIGEKPIHFSTINFEYYEVKEVWKETVIKYRTETMYRTEINYSRLIACLVLSIIGISLVTIERIAKKQNKFYDENKGFPLRQMSLTLNLE